MDSTFDRDSEPGATVADSEITSLLVAMREGDTSAMDRLFPLVYREFHGRAHQQLARRRPGETLSTTALVHETYLKLAGSAKQTYEDRIHFYAVASRAMRQILVDYARRNATAKRGGGRAVTLDGESAANPDRAEELLALEEGLEQLQQVDPRLVQTVELRFFGGLSVEETADALGVSPRTVKRDWQRARAFLYQAVRGDEA
jgi:RNA polymerase sigma factor (TIGR02999 family)